MRWTKWSLWAVLAATFLTTAGGCELIASVDRDKIPAGGSGGSVDAGTDATGGTGTGGTSTGGTGGTGTGGTGTGGTGGTGTGGTETGGTGGSAGSEGGVPCTTPDDCPNTGSECIVNTCDGNVCGTAFLTDGTPTTTQNAGDCLQVQCDGNGATKSTPDDADLPNDNNECTTDSCDNGMPVHTEVTAGTPCGANLDLVCDQGQCVGCVTGADCDGTDDSCKTRTCDNHVCGWDYVPANTPVPEAEQTPADCKQVVCDGNGNTAAVALPTDLPDDGNECTTDSCDGSSPNFEPVAPGTPCNNDTQVCTASGTCVACVVPADCGQDTACQQHTCDNNVCGVTNTAANTPIPAQDQIPGDCMQIVCDGNGGEMTVTLDTDLPDDSNDCTTDTCDNGSPVHTPVTAGTHCGTGGTLVCDNAGHCVGCNSVDDCTGTDTLCQHRTCDNQTCGMYYEPDDTEVGTQTPNDCKHTVCDGAGNQVTRNLDTDVPADDGNPCTAEACDNGTPDHPAVADNTPCDDGNACTQTDTCQSGTCTGGNLKTCTPSNSCHTSVCNPTTGNCDESQKQDNTPCDDGNACTQTDTCQSGTCTGANPKTCTALDQCHDVGTCDPATGLCSNPAKQDNTPCDDGNACTQTDTCQSGTCTGANPKTCTALDQCHDVGTCNPATGSCSNPPKQDGTSCNDGDACTQTDTCQQGTCTGGNSISCTTTNECLNSPGTCNSNDGSCSFTNKANGTSCTATVDYCLNDTTLRDYGSTAGCLDGICETPFTDVQCGAGCDAGACLPYNLIISEYVEGSSNNKAIEITNLGSHAATRDNCALRVYANGATTYSSVSLTASGVIPAGGRWTLCNTSAGTGLSPKCDQLSGTVSFNGNDVVEIVCDGVVQDTFGQIGNSNDIGSGTTSAVDHTLRRLCTVTVGDKDGSDAFDPASEWAGFQTDSFDDVGSRACTYQHTLTIDGTNDFHATDEMFATSSTGYTGYVTWDATYLYVGMSGPDLSSGSSTKFLTVYLGGAAPTTTTGVNYSDQQPTLPFGAKYHLRWKFNNNYTNAMVWNGTAWVDAGWDFTGDVYQTGTYVEIRIPFADIEAPTTVPFHMAIVDEAAGTPKTYAGVPSSSFTDGPDPDYTKYYEFAPTTLYAPWAFAVHP